MRSFVMYCIIGDVRDYCELYDITYIRSLEIGQDVTMVNQ